NIRSDAGALITPSVSDKEMTEEKNSSFKPPKKTGHIFLSQFSKDEGGSRFKLDKARHKLGFITGYGNEKAFNVMYTYEVIFFQFQYYYSLLEKKGWGVELLLQPQYNITKYKNGFSGEEKMNGHEFGLNMGFLVRKNIVKGIFSSYVIISAGPHYISGAPERQADGFIFSDNFLAGISVKVFKSVYIDVRGGFRHLSNAGFENPNKGINSLILNTGLFLQL
ncbi:MAG TPA: acyloxyacyl hydrolase, partial [Chitinophagaceae bacterium]|nr:acyloxyacyl hydrolase [Chitinophagaceae bacterium]